MKRIKVYTVPIDKELCLALKPDERISVIGLGVVLVEHVHYGEAVVKHFRWIKDNWFSDEFYGYFDGWSLIGDKI